MGMSQWRRALDEMYTDQKTSVGLTIHPVFMYPSVQKAKIIHAVDSVCRNLKPLRRHLFSVNSIDAITE